MRVGSFPMPRLPQIWPYLTVYFPESHCLGNIGMLLIISTTVRRQRIQSALNCCTGLKHINQISAKCKGHQTVQVNLSFFNENKCYTLVACGRICLFHHSNKSFHLLCMFNVPPCSFHGNLSPWRCEGAPSLPRQTWQFIPLDQIYPHNYTSWLFMMRDLGPRRSKWHTAAFIQYRPEPIQHFSHSPIHTHTECPYNYNTVPHSHFYKMYRRRSGLQVKKEIWKMSHRNGKIKTLQ